MGVSGKLLIHVAQKESWNAAIGNAANFIKAGRSGEDLEIRIVANGDSVTSCAPCQADLLDRLTMLSNHGVGIFLCENSLRSHGIAVSSLAPILRTVPAGIRALVELQGEGWRYVRP